LPSPEEGLGKGGQRGRPKEERGEPDRGVAAEGAHVIFSFVVSGEGWAEGVAEEDTGAGRRAAAEGR